MELGKRLQELRKEKGISLDDLAEQTRIQKRYLMAIEEHDFSAMPGNFYVRAFVREYAEALDLNGDELLDEHADELPSVDERTYDYVTPSRKSKKGTKAGQQMLSFLPKIFVLILIIGIGFAIWYSYVNLIHPSLIEENMEDIDQEIIGAPEDSDDEEENEEQNSEPEQDQDEEEEQNENEEETEEEIEESPSLSVTDVEEGNIPRTTYTLQNADSFTLNLSTDDQTYLGLTVTEDGQANNLYESMFSTDDSPLEFESEGDQVTAELNVGLASSLDIQVNGIDLEYEIEPNTPDSGENVHQHIVIEWNND
ncbi:helix-turn-helix domain-containing protein [Alkalibacillus aidingensis]|uniref:helix-turn-helix domain-containing protein n=1 Tax=Alkalibacillus aidingensis TaxID=2747607 RepID=UPI001660E362|nr:helix-turn-helix domain-containing protein [Alkalibacillus aidingensis]